ncbi:hypothetical protein F0Q53_01220 [Anaplasma marginale]|uniref:Uncharacterized protein n=2 Tax=Anaplasma marginale TaxID=770 RepID=B9KH46_ANAMF|nr:hypothetical protein [Anaplasma marginale]ACM49750.1 Conserved hypothetical protein [Anaplasma marginale str. Florida]AGZ79213.1 hypothetical protein U128_04800 [Anaplasma marginale str. Gypsy Plains]AAV87044.1 hypothetical protein AM1228 [Anaplasma marginale str. St. Maries]AHW57118.1 hypothetical protein [Anaplasma marginale]AXW84419.1 hypothetical protein CQZ76_04720 [Anaplasma marginale]
MITYAIISKKEAVLSFADALHVENFKKVFTTLDASTASRAIFSHDVSISYHAENRAELVPEQEFTYHSANSMINHLLNHGFSFKAGVLSDMMAQACNLRTEGIVVLESDDNCPSYTVHISRDTVFLSPASERYLDFSSGPSKELVEILRGKNSISCANPDVKNRYIEITTGENICNALASLSNALAQVGAVPWADEEFVRKQIISLAFLDSTSNELRVVQNIASYPSAHPLSKYKDVAKTVENILYRLSNKTCDTTTLGKLEDALEQRGEFCGVPPVLTKGFAKLSRDFGPQLQDIINSDVPQKNAN